MITVNFENIQKEVVLDLKHKIDGEGEKVDTNTLNIIVKSVIREIIQIREYPESWDEESIVADLGNYYSTIMKVAEYDFNMMGAEGELSHSENGVSRNYVDRNTYFKNVYKFVKVLA